MKLFFLGLDGCAAQIMYERNLPNVTRLLDRCSYQASMAEEDFPYTGPSWTNIYTGVRAADHGVTDLWGRETESSASYDTLDRPMVWEMLNEAGLTTGVIHMPVTTTSRKVNGYIVSGFPNDITHEGAIAELMPLLAARDISDLIRLTPRDRVLDNSWYRRYTLDQSIDLMKMMVEWKAHALRTLLRTHPVDCLFVQYSFLDRIGHLLNQYLRVHDGEGWDYSPVLELYDWMDGILGELLDVGEEYERLVIVSDHGWPAEAGKPYLFAGKLFGAWHSHDGVLIMSGPEVEPGRKEMCMNSDIAHKTLESLGFDIGELSSRTVIEPAQAKGGGGRKPDADVIEERLRALGYL